MVFICPRVAIVLECTRTSGGIIIMLTANESLAIAELKTKTAEKYNLESMILFGSKARGDDDKWSDIDLLVILRQKVNTAIEEQICNLAYGLELVYDVVFGIIVFDKDYWDGIGRYISLRSCVERDGKAA